jgi:hypothetical protein
MIAFPDGAARYRDFRSNGFGVSEARVAKGIASWKSEIAGELEIQARWFAGEYGREFAGAEQESIEIVQYGHWNRGAGPDFTECAVRIDGELKAGSIEVDREPGCWEQHGHGSNSDFDDTVLHVCLHQPTKPQTHYTRTSQHRAVPMMFLTDYELTSDTVALRGAVPEARRGRCATPLADLPIERLDSLLEAAAHHRLKRKSRRLTRIARAHGDSQALFQGVAEALGYRHNTLAMAVLSLRLPVAGLRARAEIDREAALFGAAGFIEHETFVRAADDQARDYLKSLWSAWWRLRDDIAPTAGREIGWKLSGTRPTNHPQRRLGALAVLANRWPEFLDGLPDRGEPPSTDWVRPLREFLSALQHPYWSRHYTLRSQPSRSPLALLGRDQIIDLLGNVIYPHLLGRHPSEWSRYSQLSGSLVNGKLRRAAIRLFGNVAHPLAKHSLRTFAGQQALLQIYADFCLEDLSECASCPFPEQLRQW